MGEPGQGLYLNLRPAQFPEGFLGCIQFQMAIGGAQGGFQLREVLRAEQVIHALPHGVAELGSFGQCLPRTGQIAVPDILHGGVDVIGDILRELLYPEGYGI